MITLFGNKHRDLYHLIRDNIRGGLSMVFHRYHHKEETLIKRQYGENAKVCKSIHGFDVSSMYLSNLMRELPTGAFVRRRRENGFWIEHSRSYGIKATQWIEWMGSKLNLKFQHMFNSDEKRVGGKNLPVDGYAETDDGRRVVLQYLGCYFHSHMCQFCTRQKHSTDLENTQNQLKTYQNLQYLTDLGYEVHYVWECQFDLIKVVNKKVSEFVNKLNFLVDTRPQISEQTIIREVQTGALFGMVEVDIETPPEYYHHFAEFQPVIKRASVSKEDIGSVMKRFADENGLLKKPSETLLCSYHGNKILLATPLLRWYLGKGLKVTKVYQVIQYKPMKCFEKFGQEVMKARREGDADPSKQIISASSKLMG
jgi:G:T-mismatch repair DNA endonuclease (very short patch repair protein)